MHTDTADEERRNPDASEDQRDEPTPEDETSSDAKEKLPFAPSSDDDSPVGDTDQHSDA